MFNFLASNQNVIFEKFIGLLIVVVLIGFLLFVNYKKCDYIIKSSFSNWLIIFYSIACIILASLVIWGSNIMLTSEPNLGLVIVGVFMVVVPSGGAIYVSFLPILALIKTVLRKSKLKPITIVFACVATLSAIATIIMLFIVF